jgi:hypothetical protein
MAKLRWLNLLVVLSILVSFSPYPAVAQSGACGTLGHHFQYWDTLDANGNCPANPTTLVGERIRDCEGYVYQWGIIGGCDVTKTYIDCGPCYPQ